jgi:hypothetical protein
MSQKTRNTTLRTNPPANMSGSNPRSMPVNLDEHQRARGMGLTVEVYRLQEELRRLPLVPRRAWLREKRARIVANLYDIARRHRCLSHINPSAACD